MDPLSAQQAHIVYSGRVQGVGFRFTVQRIAHKLKLTGWVKNLPDGRVETVLEGKTDAIEQFCQSLEENFKNNIKNKHIELQPAQGCFKDFEIAF